MPRKPGAGRKPTMNEEAKRLQTALKFCSVIKAPTATSQPYNHYIMLNEGWAVSFDGVVAAGTPADIGVNGYPHFKLLLEALDNVGKQYSLTAREDGSFEINSGDYNSLVPSLAFDQIVATPPDPNQWPLNNKFREAMEKAAFLASDNATELVQASIYSTGATLLATNMAVFIEAWHGNSFPPGLAFPKAFATALKKTDKNIVGFGFTPSEHFTVHFEDGSWLRTNLYRETWPENMPTLANELFTAAGEAKETPRGMFAAVAKIEPFTADDGDYANTVLFTSGLVRSHPDPRVGAAVKVPSIDFEGAYNAKFLLDVQEYAEKIAFGTTKSGIATMAFYGGVCRGVIAARKVSPALPAVEEPAPAAPPVAQPEQPAWGQPGAAQAWANNAEATEPPFGQGQPSLGTPGTNGGPLATAAPSVVSDPSTPADTPAAPWGTGASPSSDDTGPFAATAPDGSQNASENGLPAPAPGSAPTVGFAPATGPTPTQAPAGAPAQQQTANAASPSNPDPNGWGENRPPDGIVPEPLQAFMTQGKPPGFGG